MNVEPILQKIGLTQNEVKVYLALLRAGKSTSYTLIKEANISSGKIYETLDKLIKRGLASYVVIRGRKHFLAADPEKLVEYLQRKEQEIHRNLEEINTIIPELKLKKKVIEEEAKAEIYEEIEGIKTVYELMLRELRPKDKILILGAPKEAGEKLDIYFDNFNKRRIEKDITLMIILNYQHPREKKLNLLKKTHVKSFSKKVTTPSWINIFGDYVAIFNIIDKPIVFLLKNRKTAESYRQYFDLMWKIAK